MPRTYHVNNRGAELYALMEIKEEHVNNRLSLVWTEYLLIGKTFQYQGALINQVDVSREESVYSIILTSFE
jgi:hypothetical protein